MALKWVLTGVCTRFAELSLYHNGYDVQGCDETGIKYFCIHALRHTYVTRAIESGMQPKTPNAETS